VVLGTAGNGWLWVCCISNQPAWVPPDGLSLRGVLSAAEEMPSPPTPTTAPTEPPTVTPTPSATPLPPFDIARGPEFPWKVSDDTLTIFVKVFEGPPDNQRPLGGYALRVLRDGVDLSQRQIVSHASVSGFDRTGKDDASSYSYNLKYELRNAGEADWSVALIRPDGAAVSPEWTFSTKGAARPNMAVFVAYWLAR
jgi:hypothetical protein